MQDIPKPKYNYSIPMTKKRAYKFHALLEEHLDKDLSLPVRDSMVYWIMDMLYRSKDFIPERTEGHKIDNEHFFARRERAVQSIVNLYIGQKLSDKVLREIAWVLAAWWDHLREGNAYRRWDMKSLVWAAVRIKDIRRLQVKGRKYSVKIQAMNGPAACMQWEMSFSGGQLQHLIRDAGCRKYDKYLDYDIVGLQFTALLRAKTKGSHLQIVHAYSTSSQHKNNKKLVEMRAGVCKGPRGTKHKKNCDLCRFGRDDCPAARFERTHSIPRECENGHQGYFRPDSEARICFGCMSSGKYIPFEYKK
jgi:hypothetical protein